MRLRIARITLAVLLALEIALLVFGPQSKDHLPDISAAEAAGKRPGWWDDAAMGLRYAAWINLGLLMVLLATAKSWTRPLSPAPLRTLNSELRTPKKWFWPFVIGAALLCLGLRLPLASKSLWWDEAWVMLQASHGKWIPDKKHDGELKFLAHDWKRCAWYYQKPTNHAPMSLLQKASLDAWRVARGAKREEFSDLAARAPALLASMAAVILLACLLRSWGNPGAGVLTAFVLALHPWHIRYGVDARAYALVVPLCISGMLAVTRLVDSSGRKVWPWFWWGSTEFLWLWAFPNAVFDITALNIVAAVLLWKQPAEKRDRWTVLLRLLVTNAFAAISFIQVFLPNLMQARHWAGQETDKHVLNSHLAFETFSYLFFGHPFWFQAITDSSGALRRAGSTEPLASNLSIILFAVLALLVLVCVVDGLLFARKRLGLGTLVLATLSLSSIAFCALTWGLQSYFYPRFVISLLPVFIASICLLMTNSRWPKVASAMTLAAFLAWFSPAIQSLLALPIAPLHDVATYVQDASTGEKSSPLIACYGLGREVMPLYEPACMPLENREDVAAVMQRARSGRRTLYIIQGYDSFNRTIMPGGFSLLDDRRLFEEIASFSGIEPDFRFHVFRMKSKPPE
ncbi:MAG TPA: hypothetical protein VGH65_08600 [Verrucomicrobiaceae bacterium]